MVLCIVYVHIRAQGAVRTAPVILVHGGPGAYSVTNRQIIDYFGQLAQDGYNLYLYDQIGSGLSALLENPEEYSVSRHVADLEAIQQTIGAEQVILIGESWGGTLVANYIAAYPDRVAKAIFSSPGPINPAEWQSPQDDLGSRLAPAQQQELKRLRNRPRFGAVYLLQTLNPRAAHNFVSDQEMDGFMDQFAGMQMPALPCPWHTSRIWRLVCYMEPE